MKNKKLSQLTMRALGFCLCLLWGSGAWGPTQAQAQSQAQDQAPPETSTSTPSESSDVEKVEVIGKSIRPINMEGLTPAYTMDRQAIESSGESSLEGVLRETVEIDGVVPGSVVEPNSSRSILTGIHSAPVLVLLNGRPFTTGPGSLLAPAGADISTIPLNAIERVEILKDGMAARYGTGAVGGVVNIITRKEGDGEVVINHLAPLEKGGSESQLGVAKNFSAGDHNFMTSFIYHDTQPLRTSDRDYLSPLNSIFANYPTSFMYNELETPIPLAHGDCGEDGLSAVDPQTGFCGMDIAPLINVIPRVQQQSAFVNWSSPTVSDWDFSSTALLTKKDVRSSLPHSPGIFYHANGAPDFVFRFFEAGRRGVAEDSLFYDINAEAQKEFDSNWSFRQNVGVSSFNMDLEGYNFIDEKAINGLYACRLNPEECDGKFFDPFETPGERGDLSSSLRTLQYMEDSRILSAQSHLEGEAQVGGTPMEFFVGLEWQKESYDLVAPKESYLFTPQFEDVEKSRDLTSAILGTEAFFLDSQLKVGFHLRRDEYSDLGGTWTPRLSFMSHLSSDLLFRGSAGRAFQAPSLFHRYGPNVDFVADMVDEVACEQAQQQLSEGEDERAAGNIARYCNPQSISTSVASNENLEMESTDTLNLGLVFNPTQNFSVGFDFWHLDRNNYIEAVFSDATKLEKAGGLAERADEIQLVRQPNGLTGVTDLLRMQTTVANLHRNQISGLDVSSAYQFPLWGGTFQISDRLTYTFFNKLQPFTQVENEDRVGLYNYLRWKNHLSLSWSSPRSYSVSFLIRSYAGYKQENKLAQPLKSYSELDMKVQWKLFEDSFLNVGGKNILASQPPLQDSQIRRHNKELHGVRGPRLFVGYKHLF